MTFKIKIQNIRFFSGKKYAILVSIRLNYIPIVLRKPLMIKSTKTVIKIIYVKSPKI